MTYTVSDADDDTDTLSFTITVEEEADAGPAEMFDLHDDNGHPAGIVHAGGRYYVVDRIDDRVYAYSDSGQHQASGDFDLGDDSEPSFAGANALGDQAYDVDTAIAALPLPEASGGDVRALSVEITRCTGQQSTLGTEGLSIAIEGTVRAGASVSSVVVTGFGNGPLAGIDSLGRMAAGELRDFSITGTVHSPQRALSCSVVVEHFNISALAPGGAVRADRPGRTF